MEAETELELTIPVLSRRSSALSPIPEIALAVNDTRSTVVGQFELLSRFGRCLSLNKILAPA